MGRAPCCDKNGLKKGPWTPEEDQKLIDYIQKNGYGNWRTLPKNAGLERCGKSCRLRWTNYLRPDIKRGRFSLEEEDTIIQLHSILGNKWSAIASRLPGRTDNEIKNYWNTHIRKRLLRMGIDPVTHSPRLDLLDLSTILSSSHINFSRLLGIQPVINPELLRLATSLYSSSLPVQDMQVPTTAHNQAQVYDHQLMQYGGVDRFDQNPVEWQQNENSVYYGCFGSDQSGVGPGPSSETSTFQSNGSSNNNFSFMSNISTPSSSPVKLNSGCGERESYCSNMLDFEIPADILDVADLI